MPRDPSTQGAQGVMDSFTIPANLDLHARIRWAIRAGHFSVSISGLSSERGLICSKISTALGGLPMIRVPDLNMVAKHIADGYSPGQAQARSCISQVYTSPRWCVMDGGPLSVAVDHPEELNQLWWLYTAMGLTIFLDDHSAEADQHRALAARWPKCVTVDASQPPEAVMEFAMAAIARAAGV